MLACAFSHDDSLILSASDDVTLKLWDRNGNCIKTLVGHDSSVNACAFSHDDRIILSASADNTLKLWDRNGNCIKTLVGHKSSVNACAFSHDDSLILSASADNTLNLWDASALGGAARPAITAGASGVVPPRPAVMPVAKPAAPAPHSAAAALPPPIAARIAGLPTIPAHELDYKMDSTHRLGEGAFGVVYRGRWQGTEVAIKALKASGLTPASEKDFLDEMKVHSMLRHPYIVVLYGTVTDVKPHCMVLELLSGSLFRILHQDAPLPWPERLRLAEEMGSGLNYLHSRAILHRDLKSLNVLLDERQRAKLSDFGLSKVKTETAQTSAMDSGKGTIPWMAPELFGRRAVHSPASDVYAYAITLWELVSRKIPFADAASPQLVIGWVKDGEREEIPDDTPTVLRQVIADCWVAEPAKRPELSSVIAKLQAARGKQPLSAIDALTATFAGNLGSGAGGAGAATFAGNFDTTV